jgi:hypothetical protein
MKNVVLFQEMIFESDLTYKQACEALEKACKSPINRTIDFFITNQPKTKTKWQLAGYSRKLRQSFVNDPNRFVIQI